MSLADYLAKNYLTADDKQKASKKRKRRDANPSAGLVIADDDDETSSGWNRKRGDEDLDIGPTIVSSNSTEFRKSKKSNWTAVGAPLASTADQAAADAILASAAAESYARAAAALAEDDAPQVVDTGEGGDPNETYMENGAKAGLQTAAQVTASLERRKAEERRRTREDDPATSGKGQETIYRDATGRIVNVAMKRAEARRKAEEEQQRKEEDLEAMKGDVQRVEKAQRRQKVQDAKYMNIARYADDVEMNEELKEKERWNDPAAQFLTKKKAGTSVTGKSLYKGAGAPNRYGIRPGHRWDGVDRSNGFEKEYFAAQNRRKSAKDLNYAWQMDE